MVERRRPSRDRRIDTHYLEVGIELRGVEGHSIAGYPEIVWARGLARLDGDVHDGAFLLGDREREALAIYATELERWRTGDRDDFPTRAEVGARMDPPIGGDGARKLIHATSRFAPGRPEEALLRGLRDRALAKSDTQKRRSDGAE